MATIKYQHPEEFHFVSCMKVCILSLFSLVPSLLPKLSCMHTLLRVFSLISVINNLVLGLNLCQLLCTLMYRVFQVTMKIRMEASLLLMQDGQFTSLKSCHRLSITETFCEACSNGEALHLALSIGIRPCFIHKGPENFSLLYTEPPIKVLQITEIQVLMWH